MAEFVSSLGPVAWLVTLVIGAVMLFIGRKLFWLLVGVIGSLVGLVVATEMLQAQPDWIIYLAAFVGGIIGALLALFVQKIAVGVAGFVMGGYGLVWLFELLTMEPGQWLWILYIAGGIVGMILATSLFDLALIVLSAMVGSLLIVQITDFNAIITLLLFIALAAAGIAVQFRNWQRA
jgi:hypothetical protein